MRKGFLLVIVGSIVWFFFFATPSQKARIDALFGADKIIHLTQKSGEPVAPSVVQKLYEPHGLEETR